MRYKPRDAYYKRAKQEGYRSRAAYKLTELQQRFRILKSGDYVLDLGAAPGGWLQAAAQFVGAGGRVLGIDLQPIQPLRQKNIIILQGDIAAPEIGTQIEEYLGRAADCVLSDLAPKLSGIRDADEVRSLELNRIALDAAQRWLRPGGNFLVKGFVSAGLGEFAAELDRSFRSVQRTKPDATRRGSSEIYFIAKDYRAKPES